MIIQNAHRSFPRAAAWLTVPLLLLALLLTAPATLAQTAQAAKAASKKAKPAAAADKARGKGAGKAQPRQKVVVWRNGKKVVVYRPVAPAAPPKPTMGQLAGLHQVDDPLELKSGVALVVDQQTQEVLLSKNADAVLPIASITKLMTALVVLDARLSLDESVDIGEADIDTEKNTRSKLTLGTRLSRRDLLHLALMASENRAAHALGRSYPGGLGAFVGAMNAKAALLGMRDTVFVDPTGLSNRNRSSAKDLVTLVNVAYQYPEIRQYSTESGAEVTNSVGKAVRYANTNRLVGHPEWHIGLQKTGFISEAGQCLVMQAQVGGRSLIMVFLDSMGRLARIGDAVRVRKWIEDHAAAGVSPPPVRIQRNAGAQQRVSINS